MSLVHLYDSSLDINWLHLMFSFYRKLDMKFTCNCWRKEAKSFWAVVKMTTLAWRNLTQAHLLFKIHHQPVPRSSVMFRRGRITGLRHPASSRRSLKWHGMTISCNQSARAAKYIVCHNCYYLWFIQTANKSVTDWSLIAFSIAHSFLLLTAHYVVDVFVPNLQNVVVWLITPHALQFQSSSKRYRK